MQGYAYEVQEPQRQAVQAVRFLHRLRVKFAIRGQSHNLPMQANFLRSPHFLSISRRKILVSVTSCV